MQQRQVIEPKHAPAAAATRAVKVDTHGESGPTVIRTSRLALRALEPDDLHAYTALLNESRGKVDPYFPLHAETETDADVFNRHLRLAREGDEFGRAMRRIGINEDGEMIGAFSLLSISRGLEWKADVTAWLSPRVWGRGYATEAVTGLVDHAFAALPEGLGLHRLNAWIVVENDQSKRLFGRLGFNQSGEERSFLSVNEAWHMHELWTLGIDRWPGTGHASLD